MQIQIFDSFRPEHEPLYAQILNLAQTVSHTYPDYECWFREKFMPGLRKKERMYVVAQDDEGGVAGFVLIKKTAEEKKICTLFVDPKFRKQGLGQQLMKRTLAVLGPRPLITVSGRNLPQLAGLLDAFGFQLSAVKKRVYRADDAEYYFNDPKADAVKNGLIPVLMQRMKQLKHR